MTLDPYCSANELARSIRAGKLSSEEITALYLERIDGSSLNAVVTLDRERAVADSREADRTVARGEPTRPLHGVPITIKDSIAVGGVRTTGGAPELSDHVPDVDAPAVARLRAAGAIVLGKTNLPTWSTDIQTYNAVFGTTVNPWDHDYTPGGSSGGSGAAVAAGLTGFDLAADIGGSIRIPAHFCGVYGWKPTYGLVPATGYVDRVDPSTTALDINVLGLLARSPDDFALALRALRAEPALRGAWRAHLGSVPRRRLRVGTWFDDPACPVDREYLGMLHTFGERLSAHADVLDSRPPVQFAQQWRLFEQLGRAATSHLLPEQWHASESGRHATWLSNQQERARLTAVWQTWFDDVDAVLLPVLAIPNLRRDEQGSFADRLVSVDGRARPHSDVIGWCGLVGVLGLPSVVVPIGRTASGLPAGVQIVTDLLCDPTAIELARTCAAAGVSDYASPPTF